MQGITTRRWVSGGFAMAGALALASLAGCSGPGGGPSAADQLSGSIDPMIRSVMKKQRIVGMSALVMSGDRRVLASGYGFADRSRQIPVTVDTVFPLASVTKVFTATAVMQLAEQGLIDLDAPVSRYLHELAQSGRFDAGPPVRQLLTHPSGLTGNIMEGVELKEPDPPAFRKVPRLLANLPPASAPGTVFAYCNAGYSLLGCVVEKASGTGYAEFVTRGILEPLGMSRTRFFLTRTDAESAAIGYEGRTPVPLYPIRDVPAGALLSTASDMERFVTFVFDQGRDGVLSRKAFDEMIRRQNAGVALDGDFTIGLGWWLISPFPADETFVSHAGDIPPHHSVLVTIPDRRIGVFLAANSSRDPTALIPLAVEIVRAVYADRIGAPVDDPPLPPKARLDGPALERLAGCYASPLGLLRIDARHGRILTRVSGAPVELVPRADGCFTAELSLLGIASVPVAPLKNVRFHLLEADGKTHLCISMLGIMAGVAEKLDAAEVPQAWKNRTGSYAIVSRDPNARYRWPRDVVLELDRRSGLLLLTYTLAGSRSSFPLRIGEDDAAALAGTGTGLGDAVTARDEGGDVLLEWAGLLLKRQ